MSAHETLHKEEVNEALTKPKVELFLRDVLSKLKAGYYDQAWVDVILQKWSRFSYDIYDAAAFAKVWHPLLDGKILHIKLRVGTCPAANDQIADNILRLAKLPDPFETSMEFGLAAQDGFLFWRKPIRLAKSNGLEIVDHIELPSGGGAPIEVGYTQGSRSVMHFAEYGCLARWPYDQEFVTLLCKYPNTAPKRVTCTQP